jgi:cbb3-type cytochrome oxidase maturation protein
MVILVPLALALGLVGLIGFLWALKSGQYDDLDGAAWRAISDDDQPLTPPAHVAAQAVTHPPTNAPAEKRG